MVLAGAVAGGAEGTGGLGGKTVCGAGGTGLGATPPVRSSSNRLRRQSRLLEIDIEVHDIERQCLWRSMCTWWLPMRTEIERASADVVSAISMARKPSRFIEASRTADAAG
jgi:hypothetical protein